ncbi:MAG: VWA domain-containing protein [Microthrixaceae bacterium]
MAVDEAAPAAAPSPSARALDDSPTLEDESGPLAAGSVDDNEHFDDFLAYLARVDAAGVARRPLDPTGRIVIKVADEADRPLAGVTVSVSAPDGAPIATVITTAGGRALFHPSAYGDPLAEYSVSAGGDAVTAKPGASVAVDGQAPKHQPAALDIAFVIDATGSMGDEIGQLTASVDSVVQRIEALPSTPDLRLSLTVYRDKGDAYVSATHDFTGSLAEFREALALVEADGGGDTPEALDEALGDALTKPNWRPAGAAAQLVFLIADASGHADRRVPQPYTESMRVAAERGVKVFPISSSEADDAAEVTFRQLAQFTGSRFVFLSYGAGGAATGENTDIDSLDYEELSLDDLVVRLVDEELAGRRLLNPTDVPATTTTAPSPTTSSTSIPPGQ